MNRFKISRKLAMLAGVTLALARNMPGAGFANYNGLVNGLKPQFSLCIVEDFELSVVYSVAKELGV